MAENKAYGLADLSFTPFKMKCANGVDEMSFRVWGGMLRVEVRNTKSQDFKPVFSKSINMQLLTMLCAQMNRIKSASPETNLPMVLQRYNPEQKHWDTDWVISFQKDNKMVYHIIIQTKGNKYDAVLKGPGGVAYGSEPISDGDKSQIALATLENYFKRDVPIQVAMTSKKREFNSNNGGGNGGAPANNNPPPAGTSGEDYF